MSAEPLSHESTAFRAALDVIRAVEPRVADAIGQEVTDQREMLKLIASENYASPATLLAMGNWFSDKYARAPSAAASTPAVATSTPSSPSPPSTRASCSAPGTPTSSRTPASTPTSSPSGPSSPTGSRCRSWRRPAPARSTTSPRPTGPKLRQAFGNQRMLGMSLDAGGHLTHGFRPNISGKMFDQRSYGTDPATGLIDYEALRASARDFKPLIIVAGYSAYPRLVNFRIMREIADEVGATLMVDMAHFAGLVAGKVLTGDFDPVPHAQIVTTTTHKSLRGPRGGMVLCDDSLKDQVDRGCPMVLGGPLPHVMAAKAVALAEARQPAFQDYAQRIVDNARALAEGLTRRGATLVTGGTDNHLNLIDVATSYGLTGRQAEAALLDSGIVTNRNAIPADPNGAWYTSGIRIGTPALTTRGLGTAEMDEVAGLIDRVLTTTESGTTKSGAPSKAQHVLDAKVADEISRRATDLVAGFPLYPEIDLG